MIEFRSVRKTVPGRHRRRRRLRPGHPVPDDHGLRRVQRLRQDHDAPHDQPHGRPHLGHRRDRRRGRRRRSTPSSSVASIGYVMQNSGLLPHRKVVDNIATVPLLTGVSKAEARERALELMDTVGLDRAFADRYPSQLSGGQQQRVGVARGLAVDPNILLMDEPFGAVDPLVRNDLQDELIRLQRELGKTVVFVTHDIDEAFKLGDQVVILKKGGEIAQQGTPAEILAEPADDFVADVHRRRPRARARSASSRPRPARSSSTAKAARPAC